MLTLNSLVPDNSFVVSKWDLRGANVIKARSFFDDFDRKGWDTYRVPSVVLKPPLLVRPAAGADERPLSGVDDGASVAIDDIFQKCLLGARSITAAATSFKEL